MNNKLLNILSKSKPNSLILIEKKYSDINEFIFSYIKSINCDVKDTFCDECYDCKKINNGSYFDLKIIDGNVNNFHKDEIKSIINSFQMSSLEQKGNKFLVIKGIENSNSFVSNTMLKTIESPPKNTYFIFTTRNKHNIIPTIKSRCEIYTIDSDIDNIIKKLTKKLIPSNHIDALMKIFFNYDEMITNYENDTFMKVYDFSNKLINSKNAFSHLKKLLDDFKKMSYYEIELIINYLSSIDSIDKKIEIFQLIELTKINVNKILIFNELTNLLFWE